MGSLEVSTRRLRIAELAERHRELAFTALNHHLDVEWLREAHRRTPKNRGPGVDGQRAQEYEKDLEGNLESLLCTRTIGLKSMVTGVSGSCCGLPVHLVA